MVITDMTMPGMSGEKLAQEILEIRPGIPIIICTGFSNMMNPEKASQMGIKGFLMKPLTMSDLSKGIRNVLDKD
jgi:DNA-binding NtrC family response regulator